MLFKVDFPAGRAFNANAWRGKRCQEIINGASPDFALASKHNRSTQIFSRVTRSTSTPPNSRTSSIFRPIFTVENPIDDCLIYLDNSNEFQGKTEVAMPTFVGLLQSLY